jgi:adenine specific DNA methylase Mod
MTDKSNIETPTGLYWKGKQTEVDRIVLPFQTIETVNESRATREKERGRFSALKSKPDTSWYNRLIWGDNKYITASLLEEFAGKVDLVYIDPPFATGADFSIDIELGDTEWTKEPSAIEDKAYRDTWGKGLDSYLQMIYERLVLIRELLSSMGIVYVHCDWRVNSYIRLALDEVFGKDNFRNEIIWCYTGASQAKDRFIQKHETIYAYTKGESFVTGHPNAATCGRVKCGQW